LSPETGHFEQCSNEIWDAVCSAIKLVIEKSNIDASSVKAIGFDATCSLVILDDMMQPLTVSYTGEAQRNVIMWMDHRALKETDYINSIAHPALNNVGGAISPEMQPPKLLWLKRCIPASWMKCGAVFDLVDFLTFMATGDSTIRGGCSLICKWCYSESVGWQNGFLAAIGLEDVIDKVGSAVVEPAKCSGRLSRETASQCGLPEGIAVAAGVIDAYSGALGTIGLPLKLSKGSDIGDIVKGTLCMIAGTSACHIVSSEQPVHISGIWGPYWSVMVPGYWSLEAGQTAAGKLLDFLIESHPAHDAASKAASNAGKSIYEFLNEQIESQKTQQGLDFADYLVDNLHVVPDFHGNRSPLANPTLKGMISGLQLDGSLNNLAKLYLAALFSLAVRTILF
jgi:FGGY-family pentulose kinase